ncbi:MAG: hypothetical protein ACFHWX_23115 [Bacteroidota bacterium]
MKLIPCLLALLLLVNCNGDKDPEPGPDDQDLNTAWDFLNPQVFDLIDSTETRIQLDLKSNALWYHDSQAGLMYTEVTGDFTISAIVRARKKSDNDQVVDCDVCLGGLMARDPLSAGGQNYVHIVTGNTPAGLGVETKRTENSVSTYEPVNNGSADNELRIQRIGSEYKLYKRAVGATTWIEAATYQHDNLPETLQVGINIYTAQSGTSVADLSVIYEGIVLEQ